MADDLGQAIAAAASPRAPARSPALRLLDLLSSPRLTVVILALLSVLTLLGTLHQVEHGLWDAKRRYFDSVVARVPVGGVDLPLPGAAFLMPLLFVNLLLGGIVRLRIDRARVGVLITHLGIAFLLVTGFVQFLLAREGLVALDEGETTREATHPYDWEIVVSEPLPDGQVREFRVGEDRFSRSTPSRPVAFRDPSLPFVLEAAGFLRNSVPLRPPPGTEMRAPVVDGFALFARAPEAEAEQNVAGCYVRIVPQDGGDAVDGILWGMEEHPLGVEAGGRRFGISLRKQVWDLPFALRLERFEHEYHPGTRMARRYESAVAVVGGGTEQQAAIRMNEPLRRDGVVVYQSSWGPPDAGPGTPLYSVFSVVENPADRWPLYACVVIALGMLVQFARGLLLFVRSQAREARDA